MEPLAALGIAGNIIQIVDFASSLVSRSHELYQSADGKLADHTVLHSAAQTLLGLCDELRLLAPESELPRGPAAAAFVSKPAGSKEPPKLSAADARLVQLMKDCEAAANKLRAALNKASGSSRNNAWKSVYQALKSIHSDQEITKLASQLEGIRKQVDSTVLVSIRQRVDAVVAKPASAKFPSNLRGFQIERDQRDKKLLEAVYANNWTGTNAQDVEEFSRHLRSNTSKSQKEQFCDLLLPRLYFQHMVNRSESISEAHKETFEWLFDPRYSFSTWLQEKDEGLYWITGKPGSGKSTLMKFLYNHKTLDAQLSAWADSRGGPKKITKTGFYCWNSGSDMQMSRLGLLQTLLHHCLSGDTELCLRAFPERWKQFAAFGGGLETSWDWFELKRAFENIISDQSRSYFILIDGLDEFDGELKDIIKLVLGAVRPNVKMCVASRPWLPFEDAFKGRPNLLLQDLTQHDISTYVAETFRENEHYIRLQLDAPTEAGFLCQSIVEKALGVFLWVHLVVESLLEGLSNSDNLRDLQARHDALPSDLEALFENLLHSYYGTLGNS
ncbi:uncharacterized protein J4E79_011783 [Alternaria viburni]|uniref:uncharacterized protein n=1 Tax=Alternaria viburni TaxID=566460 RepID=UPI0020C2FA0E|nr:uncharacterized protein J4E79_011783 [Alternaria viburni]KAI4640944.1 hypothetical protein J4E79_011783 [Alternaria viburni]